MGVSSAAIFTVVYSSNETLGCCINYNGYGHMHAWGRRELTTLIGGSAGSVTATYRIFMAYNFNVINVLDGNTPLKGTCELVHAAQTSMK